MQNRNLKTIFVLAWAALFIAWTVALLRPIPAAAVHAISGTVHPFWFGKTLHVGVYCCLSFMTAWLPFSRRTRFVLLAILFLHGGATEFLQQFVPGRTASPRDVGLDTLGSCLGVALCWRRWRGSCADAGRVAPQVQLQADAGQQHRDAADLR
jgi:VanZ family protein